jgi:hypothetical protein
MIVILLGATGALLLTLWQYALGVSDGALEACEPASRQGLTP